MFSNSYENIISIFILETYFFRGAHRGSNIVRKN